MKLTFLTTASAVALMGLATVSMAPASMAVENVKGRSAAETETDLKRMQPDPDQVLTEQEAERALDKAKVKIDNVLDETRDTLTDGDSNVYVKTKADSRVEYTLFGDEPEGVNTTIQANATATGMLDQPVNNMANDNVGTLRDIIIDSKGNAKLAVVSDTRIPGIGKEAAFEYSMIMRQNANGDVVMPISEDRIKAARSFSYDQSEAGEDADVRTIPAGGYSVDKLLSADVVDPQGKTVASVENITFRNGKADALIIGYDKTLGLGGKKAALRFSEVKLQSKGDGNAQLQLSARQAAQLSSMKNSASN